jgi:hypothetical protein
MTKKGLMAEDQLIVKAINLLMEALGPVETSRFLALPRAERTESVKRHRVWQASLTKAAFFDKVFDA